MTIESEFLIHRKEKIITHRNGRIGPGASHSYDDMRSEIKVTACLDHTETRGTIIINGGLSELYAIKHFGQEDLEGEIVDLSEGKIQTIPGDEVRIVRPARTHTKELTFYHEQPSGDVSSLPIPGEGLTLEK